MTNAQGLTPISRADLVEELFASRSLDLVWLPAGAFASPSLHAVPGGALPRWFWRVDAAFGAWMWRLVERAKAAKAFVSDAERRAARTVAAYLAELGEWDAAKALPPAPLPEGLIVSLTGAGLAPDWDGRADWLAKRFPPAAPAGPEPAPASVLPKARKRPRPKRSRADATRSAF